MSGMLPAFQPEATARVLVPTAPNAIQTHASSEGQAYVNASETFSDYIFRREGERGGTFPDFGVFTDNSYPSV